jgi:hypothetical protein
MLYSGAEDVDRAAGLAELAVLDAGDDPAALARALEVARDRGHEPGAAGPVGAPVRPALALYQERHDAAGAARILDGRAMATFLDGRIPAALELFSQVADLLTDSGDLLHVVTPASTAGHALVFGADPAAGLVRTTAALELARSLGHAEGVTYALWHRSEALAALGDADEGGRLRPGGAGRRRPDRAPRLDRDRAAGARDRAARRRRPAGRGRGVPPLAGHRVGWAHAVLVLGCRPAGADHDRRRRPGGGRPAGAPRADRGPGAGPV